jgi:hypothetical protein
MTRIILGHNPRDADGHANQILDLNPITRLEVLRHRLRPDPRDVDLALRILHVGEAHIPRHLAVNAEGLYPLEDSVACAFEHVDSAAKLRVKPRKVASFVTIVDPGDF